MSKSMRRKTRVDVEENINTSIEEVLNLEFASEEDVEDAFQ